MEAARHTSVANQQRFAAIANQLIKEFETSSLLKVETWTIAGRTLHFLYFDQVPSTMILSQAWPRDLLGANVLFAFVANSQTQGQGQKTNTWSSPPGNVYMTILGELPTSQIPLLSMAVSISVCRMIYQKFKLKPKCKWINDVYLNQKKVSGNLIRTEFGEKADTFVVQIGIGINVKKAPLQSSTCLEQQLKGPVWVPVVIEEQVKAMFQTLDAFTKGQEYVRQSIQEYIQYLGQKVYIYDFELKNIQHQGIFKGITPEANVILTTEHGEIVLQNGRMRRWPV